MQIIDAAEPATGSLASLELSFLATLASERHGFRYLGPTLRGALGFALRDICCCGGATEGGAGPHRDDCSYALLFEGRPPPERDVMRKYPAVPQPFVLLCAGPERWLGDAAELRFGVRLFGPTAAHVARVVEAFRLVGSRGIGPDRVPFEIRSIRSDGRTLWKPGDATVAPCPSLSAFTRELPTGNVVRFRFETPVDLGLGRGETIDGLRLTLAGRRRLFLLQSFYGVAPCSTESRVESGEFRTLEADLRHWRIERHSGRQARRVPLEGHVGEVTIEGPWPRAGRWLSAIERISIGKHTSFGLGRVTWQETT